MNVWSDQGGSRGGGLEAYIGGVFEVRDSLKRATGSADRDDQSNMAAKEEPLNNMENAMQSIDRMNEVELATIAKYAITQLQARLPLSLEQWIACDARPRTKRARV